jgi:hypothetical protein
LGGIVLGPAPTISRALEATAHELPDMAVLDVNLQGAKLTL